MSEEQDYKTVDTAEGPVKIRNYTTGADEEAITQLITAASKTVIDNNNKSTTEVDATVQVRLDRCKVERFVITVNGSEKGADNAVYNLRTPDFKKVMAAINEVTKEIDGSADAAKKKQQTSPSGKSSTTS